MNHQIFVVNSWSKKYNAMATPSVTSDPMKRATVLTDIPSSSDLARTAYDCAGARLRAVGLAGRVVDNKNDDKSW
jgi:hypothetical protein